MKRMRLLISEDVEKLLQDFKTDYDIDYSDVIRRGLAVLKAYNDARSKGFNHIGLVDDPEKLDIELINIL